MEEKRLSSLFFGNVVLESQVSGTFPKIYADDMRSYWMRPSNDGMLSVPLDDLRGNISSDRAEKLSSKIFGSVSAELNAHYPGGKSQAAKELTGFYRTPKHRSGYSYNMTVPNHPSFLFKEKVC